MKIEDMTADERRTLAYQAMVQAWWSGDFRYHQELTQEQRLERKRRWCKIAAMLDEEFLKESSLKGVLNEEVEEEV